MNKSEFITHIAQNYDCTKVEATKIIDTFTDAVTKSLVKGNDVALVGFGNFTVSKVPARVGRNPRTGQSMQISAYNQPKFKAGKNLKDACN